MTTEPNSLLQSDHSSNHADLRRIGIDPNFWYPLARSNQLAKGKTLPVSFAGEPIVLVRTERAAVFAFEDRCAHRQVPLHMGTVCGEKLRCAYHGWQYDMSGKLSAIPYVPQGAHPPRQVRSFPCREAYNHIFVFPGSSALAPKRALPDLPTWFSPQYQTMYFSRRLNCHYSFMHENLMDMNHQFLHGKLMGMVRPALIDYTRGEDWVEASYKFEDYGAKEHWAAKFLIAGGKDASATGRDFELMTIRTQYPYQLLSVRASNSDTLALMLWSAYVPLDRRQSTNQSFGMLMIRKPRLPGLIYALWPAMRYFTESVFRQDKMIVEAEQRAHDLQGGDWNQEVFPLILSLRELLASRGVPLSDEDGRRLRDGADGGGNGSS